MRQAYVVKLGLESNPSKREFAGCIEQVDTGREMRFKSTDELLSFLAGCFNKASQREPEPDETLRE